MSKISASATTQFVLLNIFIVLVLPISSAFLAKWILETMFLSNAECVMYLKNAQMHYGHPYFLSTLWSMLCMLVAVYQLRRRFMIFDLNGRKYNIILVIFLVLAAFIGVELTSDMFFPKNKWWSYANYNWFKNATKDEVLIYLFPHLAAGFLQWQLLLVVMRIANVDWELKEAKQLLRRHQWSLEEFFLLLKKRNPSNKQLAQILAQESANPKLMGYSYSDLKRAEKKLASD
ncbi:MAG: hypothetical protein EAZ57_06955 [Cytophagales bacterium]|nr:MAG: hypothetical protein EAZ67_07580 [Cytophagales bacterium]TAF60593.1 MAG: hypothetical protein EAZ57_06955 [Cytophagales bacterium]